jgi:hypothetical protein
MTKARVFDWEREGVFSTKISRETVAAGVVSGALLVGGVSLSALGCWGLTEAETLTQGIGPSAALIGGIALVNLAGRMSFWDRFSITNADLQETQGRLAAHKTTVDE